MDRTLRGWHDGWSWDGNVNHLIGDSDNPLCSPSHATRQPHQTRRETSAASGPPASVKLRTSSVHEFNRVEYNDQFE